MTLVRGDARDVDWATALPKRWKACITDPPYGVEYQSRRGKTRDHDLVARPIANDQTVHGAAELFLDVMIGTGGLCDMADDEAELYVFTRWDVVGEWQDVVDQLELFGFKRKALLVWDKGGLGMGDIDASWCPSFELVIYAKKGRRDLNHQRESVLRFDRVPASQRIHATEKPVGLLEEFVKISTNPEDLVVDPFCGSASTLQAAINLGRLDFGVEQDQDRYDRACKRLAQQVFF